MARFSLKRIAFAVVLFGAALVPESAPASSDPAGWIAALRDPNDLVKIQALTLLASEDAPRIESQLAPIAAEIGQLFRDRDPERWSELLWRSLWLYDKLGFDDLTLLSEAEDLAHSNKSWEVRVAALDALGQHGTRHNPSRLGEIRETVLRLFRQPRHPSCRDTARCHPRVVAAALVAASKLHIPWTAEPGDQYSVKIIANHFADPDPRVREAARVAFSRSGIARVAYLERLNERLNDSRISPVEREAILATFGTLGPQAAIYAPSIVEYVNDPEPAVRLAAFFAYEAVAQWSREDLLAKVEAALEASKEDSVIPALAAVSLMRSRERLPDGAVGVLEAIFSSADFEPRLRAAAIDALVAGGLQSSCLGSLQAVLLSTRAESDREGQVRVAVLAALSGLDKVDQPIGPDESHYMPIIRSIIEDEAVPPDVMKGPTDGEETAKSNAEVRPDREDFLPTSLRAAIAAAYWRGVDGLDEDRLNYIAALLERSDLSSKVHVTAFEVLGGAPSASVFQAQAVAGFVDAEIKGRDPQRAPVRASVLRVLRDAEAAGPYLSAIASLLSDVDSDPSRDVRREAIPLVAKGSMQAEHLSVLLDVLEHDDQEMATLAARSVAMSTQLDISELSLVLDAAFQHPDRKDLLVAVAHIAGAGTPNTEMLIRLLTPGRNGDIVTEPTASADRRQAFELLRMLIRQTVFENGVHGKAAGLSSVELRNTIKSRLTELVALIGWSCWDRNKLKQTHALLGAEMYRSDTCRRLRVALEDEMSHIDAARISPCSLSAWLGGILTVILGFVLGRYIWSKLSVR